MYPLFVAKSKLETTFVLNVGETRQINPPTYFGKWIEISSTMPNQSSSSPGCNVYALPHCPSFAGPILQAQDQKDALLGPQKFEYDSFYLHPGSIITVTASSSDQTNGYFFIYLLKGTAALDQISCANATSSCVSKNKKWSIIDHAIFSQIVRPDSLSVSFDYHVTTTDMYIIFFYNPEAPNNQEWINTDDDDDDSVEDYHNLHIQYNVEMTTHNLQQRIPICGKDEPACKLDITPSTIKGSDNKLYKKVGDKKCIIVEAVGDGTTNNVNNNNTNTLENMETINVVAALRWDDILFAYCAAAVVMAVCCQYIRYKMQSLCGARTDNEHSNNHIVPYNAVNPEFIPSPYLPSESLPVAYATRVYSSVEESHTTATNPEIPFAPAVFTPLRKSPSF